MVTFPKLCFKLITFPCGLGAEKSALHFAEPGAAGAAGRLRRQPDRAGARPAARRADPCLPDSGQLGRDADPTQPAGARGAARRQPGAVCLRTRPPQRRRRLSGGRCAGAGPAGGLNHVCGYSPADCDAAFAVYRLVPWRAR